MQVLYLCLYLIYKKTSMDLNKKHLIIRLCTCYIRNY